MTEQPKPSEAAIREARSRVCGGMDILWQLAAMIEKYEPETLVVPDLKRAREIYVDVYGIPPIGVTPAMEAILRAIKETRAEYEK